MKKHQHIISNSGTRRKAGRKWRHIAKSQLKKEVQNLLKTSLDPLAPKPKPAKTKRQTVQQRLARRGLSLEKHKEIVLLHWRESQNLPERDLGDFAPEVK